MGWRSLIAALAAAATVPFGWPRDDIVDPCEGSFDASFLQIERAQLSYDTARWMRELALVRSVGVHLVIVQFSGDERGPYDRRGAHRPVAALLDAARRMDMVVFLGLHDDPAWPSEVAATWPAPPLDDPEATRELGELCSRSPACIGWYISQEIDDTHWATGGRSLLLRQHLARTTRRLRELAPDRAIAIAPFFTGALAPDQYARWWRSLLPPGTVDIFILQDGVGTGRARAEHTASYLAELRPALAAAGIELWSVAELFEQTHGPPVDDAAFEATPMEPARLRHSLTIEQPLVERIVAFAVLDYMDPRRGGDARRLHDEYAARCRTARSTGRKSC
jgi:hypothetical protein